MITSLLTLQCLLWVLPCLARPYWDQADPPPGAFLFDDQVIRLLLLSPSIPPSLQSQVEDVEPYIFPQYQLVQIMTPDHHILSDLENQLKKASGENEREEITDTKQQLEFQFDILPFLS